MHIHKKDLVATIRLEADEISLDTANVLLKDPTLKPCHIIIDRAGRGAARCALLPLRDVPQRDRTLLRSGDPFL